MRKVDEFEQVILAAYERGELVSSVNSNTDLSKFKAAASATIAKTKRVISEQPCSQEHAKFIEVYNQKLEQDGLPLEENWGF